MDEQTKVCPECGAEFFAHIELCNRCEVELVDPLQARGGAPRPASSEDAFVCIEDGSYERANELAWSLRSAGFEAKVLRAPASSCGGGFGVFVPQESAKEAAVKRDELWRSHHPELDAADESIRKGLCPACGAALMGSTEECPDCGLFVGAHGGGDGCEGDGSCGSCG